MGPGPGPDIDAGRSHSRRRAVVLVLCAVVLVSLGSTHAAKLAYKQTQRLLKSGVSPETAQKVTSKFTCVGEDANTRRCVVHNAVVRGGQIWVTGSPNESFPAVLCSGVNAPDTFRRECIVNVVPVGDLPESTGAFDVGVAWSRLCPQNAYHALFEDMVP